MAHDVVVRALALARFAPRRRHQSLALRDFSHRVAVPCQTEVARGEEKVEEVCGSPYRRYLFSN